MPRTIENFVMSLETLYFTHDPVPNSTLETGGYVWPVFFKIDGATAQVSDAPDSMGKLMGTATVSGTTGVGPACRLRPGTSVAIPAEIGQWSDQVVPIPLGPNLGIGPDVGGIFGVALAIVQPGGLESDALLAGHAAFNDGMQSALNDMITNLPASQPDVGPDQIDNLVKAVRGAIDQAIHGAMDFWDKVHGLLDPPMFGNTFAHYSQDELPAADFDQKDFDPTSGHGPAPFEWLALVTEGIIGFIGLNGAISRSRRAIGQGVLRQLAPPVRAVAGFTSPDGYQHAIAATGDGALTESTGRDPGRLAAAS